MKAREKNQEPYAMKTPPSQKPTTRETLWRAAEQAASQGDLIKALALFEAGRLS